jgi:hypothetical protein
MHFPRYNFPVQMSISLMLNKKMEELEVLPDISKIPLVPIALTLLIQPPVTPHNHSFVPLVVVHVTKQTTALLV